MSKLVWKLPQVLRDRKIARSQFAAALGVYSSNLGRGRGNPYLGNLPTIGSLGIERYRYAINQVSKEEFGTCCLTDLIDFEDLEPSEIYSEGDGSGLSGVTWSLRSVLARRQVQFKALGATLGISPMSMYRLRKADLLPVIGASEIEKLLNGITQLSEEYGTCHPTELIAVMNGRYPEEIILERTIKNNEK